MDARCPATMAAIGAPDPPRPPGSAGKVLGTRLLPNYLIRTLSDRFQVTREGGGGISLELRAGRGLHTFLGHLASRVDPVLGLDHLTLLGVNWDGTVYLLHPFFSVTVDPYFTDWRLLTFVGGLPLEGLPPVTELLVDAFTLRHAIHAVPWANHYVHVEGVPPPHWHLMPLKRVKKLQEDAQDLSFRGLKFLSPNGALSLLVQSTNIAEASCHISPLLASRAPLYDEAIDWLQFYYTVYWTGAYVAPASTDFQFATLVEGGLSLHRRYGVSRHYTPGPTPGVYIYDWPPQA